MTDITKFFEALSWRAYKENDLSDVTFAMCEADIVFKQFFLDFFFGDQRLVAGSCTISREVSYDGSRPDIVIKDAQSGVYFVEVKIWDCSHHFTQYTNTLTDQCHVKQEDVYDHFGYIAAYKIQSQEASFGEMMKRGRVKTWRDLYEALEKYSYFDNIHVKAYAEYVKSVCAIDDYKVKPQWCIKVDDFTYIQNFDKKIQAVISSNDMRLRKYTTPRRFRSCEWMGHFFEWTYSLSDGQDEQVWGWVGVRYEEGRAVLCVEFEDRPGWGKLICDKHRDSGIKGGVLRCYAKKDDVWELDEKGIKNFLKASLDWAIKRPKENYDEIITVKSDEACWNAKVLAMKNLPFVLRESFLAFTKDQCDKLEKAGYDIVLADGNDAEVPQSHCGRYFHIRKRGSDTYIEGQDYFRGWVGVQYSEFCWRQVGEEKKMKYSDKPAFVVEVRKDFCVGNTPEEWMENRWGWIATEIVNGSYFDCLNYAREKLVKFVVNRKEEESHG